MAEYLLPNAQLSLEKKDSALKETTIVSSSKGKRKWCGSDSRGAHVNVFYINLQVDDTRFYCDNLIYFCYLPKILRLLVLNFFIHSLTKFINEFS